jgi:hypothetical protein
MFKFFGSSPRSVVQSKTRTPQWTGLEQLEPRLLMAADFIVSDISITPTLTGPTGAVLAYFGPAHPADVTVTVENVGDEDAPGSRIALVWDDDSDLSNGYRIATEVDIAEIAAGGSLEVLIETFVPPWTETYETYQVAAIANVPNVDDVVVAEDDDTNNASALLDVATRGQDLDFFGYNFSVGDQYPNAGETFTIDYAVRQSGYRYSLPFTVSFYLSNNVDDDVTIDTEDYFLGSHDWISGLTGDNYGERSITVRLPDPGSSFWEKHPGLSKNAIYLVGMVIDVNGENGLESYPPDLTVNNSNLWNGYDFSPLPVWVLPDTQGQEIELSNRFLAPSQSVNVSMEVENTSGIAADPFYVSFHISRDGIIAADDREIGRYRMVDGVDGFSTVSITKRVTLPDADDEFWDEDGAGFYYIGAITNTPVTTDPVTLEEDDGGYGDNANRGLGVDYEWVLIDIPSVDLRGTQFNVQETDAEPADVVNVDYRIANSQADASGRFKVFFYLSRDNVIGGGTDKKIGVAVVNSIAGNSSSGLLSTQLTLPDAAAAIYRNGSGKYYIGMKVDGASQVSETNEFNNRNRGLRLDYDAIRIEVPVIPPQTDDNVLSRATNLGTLRAAPTVVSGFVGRSDATDFYKVTLARNGRLNIDLSVDTGNADVLLKSSNGRLILARSRTAGTADESIVKRLSAGSYYIEVFAARGGNSSNYELSVSANYSNVNLLASLAGAGLRSDQFAQVPASPLTGRSIDLFNLTSDDDATRDLIIMEPLKA